MKGDPRTYHSSDSAGGAGVKATQPPSSSGKVHNQKQRQACWGGDLSHNNDNIPPRGKSSTRGLAQNGNFFAALEGDEGTDSDALIGGETRGKGAAMPIPKQKPRSENQVSRTARMTCPKACPPSSLLTWSKSDTTAKGTSMSAPISAEKNTQEPVGVAVTLAMTETTGKLNVAEENSSLAMVLVNKNSQMTLAQLMESGGAENPESPRCNLFMDIGWDSQMKMNMGRRDDFIDAMDLEQQLTEEEIAMGDMIPFRLSS